jgi:hypothetical protein
MVATAAPVGTSTEHSHHSNVVTVVAPGFRNIGMFAKAERVHPQLLNIRPPMVDDHGKVLRKDILF